MKVPLNNYAEILLEFLVEKIDTCHSNPEKSSTTTINRHTVSGHAVFTHCSFDVTKTRMVIVQLKIV